MQNLLGTYCKCLFVWTHHEIYKLQLLGSACPLRYRDRYYLICSKHQLQETAPEDVCLLYPNGSLAVTSAGERKFQTKGAIETDAYDIVALEFTDPLNAHPELATGFFNFASVPPDGVSNHVLALVVCGYPFQDQTIDPEHVDKIGLVRRNLIATIDAQPNDDALLRGRFRSPIDFDPDGMSGGPVFNVQLVDGAPHAFFAGMMLRSGREEFHFLKSGYIKGFLDSFPK